MATFGTSWFTLRRGRLIGSDQFGNRYFEEKRLAKGGARKRRWVMYKGIVEPSKVPADWHGWLHYTQANSPVSGAKKHFWQLPHLPNLTGTQNRYLPEGHAQKKGIRAKTTADYSAWNPE
jgi:NADH:ubiquinone oxidoreductase subunit